MLFAWTVGCAQTKEQKISFIKTYSEKWGWFDLAYSNNKAHSLLYYHPTKSDSLRLVEITSILSDKQICSQRILKHLQSDFSEEEIDSLYQSYKHPPKPKIRVEKNGVTVSSNIQSTYMSRLRYKLENFMPDIKKEIIEIQTRTRESYNKGHQNTLIQKPVGVNKQDGFYTVEKYDGKSISYSSLKLSANPTISSNDIESVKSNFDVLGRITINISFTSYGGENFRKMNSENKGKPIVLVLNHKIVAAPIVNETIAGGNVELNGNFSDEEIKEMISWKKNHR